MAVGGIPEEYLRALARAGQDLAEQLGKGAPATAHLAALYQDHVAGLAELWRSLAGRREPGALLHEATARYHRLNAQFLDRLIDVADIDARARARLRFFARQFVEATSPANFAMTNPEIMQRAVESQGESLATGLRNLLADIGRGRLTMTDESAFTLGIDLATTPGAVVFEDELMQLIQYRPLTETVGLRPLLIVPPCINKYYILDLRPENSFVRYALGEGNAVFMVSWRNAGEMIAGAGWDDYLERIVRAIAAAAEISRADKVNALGFCVGGTLLGCAAAILRARGDERLASLTLLAAMLDFSDTGELGLLIDEASVAARERTIGRGGLVRAGEFAFVFAMLRARDLVWPNVVERYLKGGKPRGFDLLYWNADGTNLPGPMYCWYVRNAYLENNIGVPGRTIQCGTPLDLGRIDVPVYLLATRGDHIVPWQTAYRSAALVGSDEVRFVLGSSGHVAGIVSPPSSSKRHFWCGGKIGQDPEEWLATAEPQPGSWWSDWASWLRPHAGRRVKARRKLGGLAFRPIEPAPGRYVREKAE